MDRKRGEIEFEGQRENTHHAYSYASKQLSKIKLTELERVNRDRQRLLNEKDKEISKERDSHRKMEEDLFARSVRLALSRVNVYLVFLSLQFF